MRTSAPLQNSLYVYVTNNGPKSLCKRMLVICPQGFNLNTWTHFALVRQSGTLTMYVVDKTLVPATVSPRLRWC